jgi:hypothetical protein
MSIFKSVGFVKKLILGIVVKNSNDVKKLILELVGYNILLNLFKSNKPIKKILLPGKGTLLPEPVSQKINKKFLERFLEKLLSLSTLVVNSDLSGVAILAILFSVSTKQSVDIYNQTKDIAKVSNQNKNRNKFPPVAPFPEKINKKQKRILTLHVCFPLCSKRSINKYVIFEKKNKNNSSSIHINRGEIGQIVKKLEGWDEALIHFSVEIPSRFQKLDKKYMTEDVFNEAILILE